MLARRHGNGEEAPEIGLLLAHVPHLQKHQCKALHGLALEHYRRVLPVTVQINVVYVFVREVYAAVEGGVTVDDEYLAVVAVVEIGRDKGSQA